MHFNTWDVVTFSDALCDDITPRAPSSVCTPSAALAPLAEEEECAAEDAEQWCVGQPWDIDLFSDALVLDSPAAKRRSSKGMDKKLVPKLVPKEETLENSRAFDEVSMCSTRIDTARCGRDSDTDLELPDIDRCCTPSKNPLPVSATSIGPAEGEKRLFSRLDTERMQVEIRDAWDRDASKRRPSALGNTKCLFNHFLEVTRPVFEKYDVSPANPCRKSAAIIQDAFHELMAGLESTTADAGGSTSSTHRGDDKSADRYVLEDQLLGGGATGIVQKAFDPRSGREVAIKRLQRDSSCPIRFLEIRQIRQEGQVAPTSSVLHLEGYAPASTRPRPCNGPLFFDPLNPYGKDTFPQSADGCVVLVRRGGGVPFADKVFNAGRGGAVGVIIINSHDYIEEFALGDASKDTIPSMLISSSDGEAVLERLAMSETLEDLTTARSSTQPPPPATSRRCCVAEVRTDAEHEVAMCRLLPPHPHVIQILDTWAEGDTPVVVTELCTGGKLLRDPGSDVKGDTSAAVSLLKQMLAGLEHIHSHGVCHRDLKPENLLMTRRLGDPDARLVLIDFSMSALTQNMSVPCGSARYLAPEVVKGRYGTARDIWAAGVIGYELLWGTYPFGYDFTPNADIIKAICCPSPVEVPPARPDYFDMNDQSWSFSSSHNDSGVPEPICELIRLLLRKDPAQRPTATEALQHPALKDVPLPGFRNSDSA